MRPKKAGAMIWGKDRMIKIGKVDLNNNLTIRGQVFATVIVMLMCMLMAWLSLRDYITVGSAVRTTAY